MKTHNVVLLSLFFGFVIAANTLFLAASTVATFRQSDRIDSLVIAVEGLGKERSVPDPPDKRRGSSIGLPGAAVK